MSGSQNGAPSAWRRRVLVAGAGGVALLSGAWLSLRGRPDSGVAGVWDMAFDTPQGGRLEMHARLGRPLLVNFWATWCPPCVRELPQIDRFYRDYSPKGWQVVGLAIDGPAPVRSFLAKLPLGFPIGVAGLEGMSLVRSLGNERGGLPFTLAFGADGKVARRKLGETSYEELAGWARELA